MGSKTIYGCVDWASGEVRFVGEACDSGNYTGCIVNAPGEAEHMMVAVYVAEAWCEDWYYGCVNWTTGKFQLIIPDDCCYTGPSSEDECVYCDEGTTPTYISVRISGVTACGCIIDDGYNDSYKFEGGGAVNGTYVLEQQMPGPPSDDPCRYYLPNDGQTGDYGTLKTWNYNQICSGTPSATYDLTFLRIYVRRYATEIIGWGFIRKADHTGGCQFINGTDTSPDGCIGFSASNELPCESPYGYKGGTIERVM